MRPPLVAESRLTRVISLASLYRMCCASEALLCNTFRRFPPVAVYESAYQDEVALDGRDELCAALGHEHLILQADVTTLSGCTQFEGVD